MSSRSSELPPEQESAAPARARVLERLEALARGVGPRVAYSITALLLVALCIAAARYYAAVRSELTEVVMARRVAVAQLAAATLSERLDRMLDVGVALATRVRFAELVAAGQWDAAIQVMKSVPTDFRFVERVALFDARGTAMAAFPDSSVRGQSFASRDWYKGVSREWKPHVSGVYRRSTPPHSGELFIPSPHTIWSIPTADVQAFVMLSAAVNRRLRASSRRRFNLPDSRRTADGIARPGCQPI